MCAFRLKMRSIHVIVVSISFADNLDFLSVRLYQGHYNSLFVLFLCKDKPRITHLQYLPGF